MAKIKCPECNGCMDYVWVETTRYLYCWFCRDWYRGYVDILEKTENPFLIEHEDCEGKGCDVCKNTGKIDRRILGNSN